MSQTGKICPARHLCKRRSRCSIILIFAPCRLILTIRKHTGNVPRMNASPSQNPRLRRAFDPTTDSRSRPRQLPRFLFLQPYSMLRLKLPLDGEASLPSSSAASCAATAEARYPSSGLPLCGVNLPRHTPFYAQRRRNGLKRSGCSAKR